MLTALTRLPAAVAGAAAGAGGAMRWTVRNRLAVGAIPALCLLVPLLVVAPPAAASVDTASVAISSPTSYSGTSSVFGGSIEPVTATVTAQLGGAPAPTVTFAFTSSGDATFQPSQCTTGTTTGTCTVNVVPGTARGSQTVTATPVSPGFTSGPVSTSLMQFAPPATVTVSPAASSLTTDGAASTTATVTVKDAAGNGIPGWPVTLASAAATNPFTCGNVNAASATPVAAPSSCTMADGGNGTYTSLVTAPPPAGAAGAQTTQTLEATLEWTTPGPTNSGSTMMSLTNIMPRLTGPLTTSGTQIEQGTTPEVLQGMDHGYMYLPEYPYAGMMTNFGFLNPYTLGVLFEHGANFVRIPISSDLWLQNCNSVIQPQTYDPNYQTELAQEVKLVTSYGMYAVLDLHTTDPGCGFNEATNNSGGEPLSGGKPEPLPSSSDMASFWPQVAADFGSNPLVGFELYNEPWVCSSSDGSSVDTGGGPCSDEGKSEYAWLNGGTLTAGSTVYSAAGMVAMYDEVRSKAPTSLVFVDSNNWAAHPQDFSYLPAALNNTPYGFKNVVYVIHQYACQPSGTAGTMTCYMHPDQPADVNSGVCYDLTLTSDCSGSPWPAPMVFTEFGWPQQQTCYSYGGSCMTLYSSSNGPGTGCNVGGTYADCFVNNLVAEFQAKGVGWSMWYLDGVQPWTAPSSGSGCTIQQVMWETACNSYPWTPNPVALPAIDAMAGQTLTQITPPSGDS